MAALLPNYSLRRSPRAKNIRLKVTREDGLLVVVPEGYDEGKIPSLLKQKKVWITDALKRVGETKRFLEPKPVQHLPETVRLVAIGETWSVTYLDEVNVPGVRLRADDRRLIISGSNLNRDAVIRKLKEWLRMKVRRDLFPLAEELATRHRLSLGGLLVKSQRTRWASCSGQRNLSLNTKLLFLSPDIVRYVLVHELCHTTHMSHSKDFFGSWLHHSSRATKLWIMHSETHGRLFHSGLSNHWLNLISVWHHGWMMIGIICVASAMRAGSAKLRFRVRAWSSVWPSFYDR
jgi:predicted metal-dependent hydrolase